jgi:hypothetical protein
LIIGFFNDEHNEYIGIGMRIDSLRIFYHVLLPLLRAHIFAASSTTEVAAVSKSLLTITLTLPLFFSAKSFIKIKALSALVPVSLTTIGTLTSTYVAALMIPSAITSHFIIPPKILTKIALTCGC